MGSYRQWFVDIISNGFDVCKEFIVGNSNKQWFAYRNNILDRCYIDDIVILSIYKFFSTTKGEIKWVDLDFGFNATM